MLGGAQSVDSNLIKNTKFRGLKEILLDINTFFFKVNKIKSPIKEKLFKNMNLNILKHSKYIETRYESYHH